MHTVTQNNIYGFCYYREFQKSKAPQTLINYILSLG